MSFIILNKELFPAEDPCICHNDRGFTLGHGLFETILIKNENMLSLGKHWKRLEQSATCIGIVLPFSYAELQSMLSLLIKHNKLEHRRAGARLTISHGESSRGLLPQQILKPNFVISVFEQPSPTDCPFKATIVSTRKNEQSISSRLKSISYLDNILAKKEATKRGYEEAILLNSQAFVADGSFSNVYMVKAKQIFTPSVSDGALAGVIRSILLEDFAKEFPIVEKTISPEELMRADEIFLSNALMGVKSVSRLDTKDLDDFVFAKAIQEALIKRDYI